jgi:hypothetical protein
MVLTVGRLLQSVFLAATIPPVVVTLTAFVLLLYLAKKRQLLFY